MKKKKALRLTTLVLVCILVSMFSVPVFATSPSPTTNTGGGNTGFGTDAFDFNFDADGTMKITTGGTNGNAGFQGVVQSVIDKFRMFCAGATGIVIIVVMLVLIIAFGALAIKSNNANERAKIGEGIFWKLAAAAGVVVVPMLVGLAANFFV